MFWATGIVFFAHYAFSLDFEKSMFFVGLPAALLIAIFLVPRVWKKLDSEL